MTWRNRVEFGFVCPHIEEEKIREVEGTRARPPMNRSLSMIFSGVNTSIKPRYYISIGYLVTYSM
jgi:hypothetical protein